MSNPVVEFELTAKDFLRQYFEQIDAIIASYHLPITHINENHKYDNTFVYTFYSGITPVFSATIEFTQTGIKYTIRQEEK